MSKIVQRIRSIEEKYANVDSHLLFEIASNSKAFTALGILILEKRKKLVLFDSISKYIPEIIFKDKNGKKCEITIYELLTHTSGISSLSFLCMDKKKSIKETVNLISKFKVISNRKFFYSTGNYCILGYIIEKISGMSYAKFVERNIFKPLKLNESSVGINKQNYYKMGCARTIFGIKTYKNTCINGFSPAGYIYMSISDLQKWVEYQVGKGNIPNEYQNVLKRSHDIRFYVPTGKKNILYGFGWYYNVETKCYYHEGFNPFFSSAIFFRLDLKKGVFGVSNIQNDNIFVKTKKKMYQITNIDMTKDPIDEQECRQKKIHTFSSLFFYCIYLYTFVTSEVNFKVILLAYITRVRCAQFSNIYRGNTFKTWLPESVWSCCEMMVIYFLSCKWKGNKKYS